MGARFEYDSSDTEDEEEDREKRKEEGQVGTSQERARQFGTGLAPPPSLSEKMFFLDKDDDRFKGEFIDSASKHKFLLITMAQMFGILFGILNQYYFCEKVISIKISLQ